MYLDIVPADDLPLWGRVGRMVDNEIDSEQDNADTDDDGAPAEYIYTHKIFTIGYNDDRVSEKLYDGIHLLTGLTRL
jgi:hypothetical protein